MEHRGVRYVLVQTAEPAGWKWVVHLTSTKTQTGFSSDKQLAIHAAKRAIECDLFGRKRREQAEQPLQRLGHGHHRGAS